MREEESHPTFTAMRSRLPATSDSPRNHGQRMIATAIGAEYRLQRELELGLSREGEALLRAPGRSGDVNFLSNFNN
jgi:hypothetical protein